MVQCGHHLPHGQRPACPEQGGDTPLERPPGRRPPRGEPGEASPYRRVAVAGLAQPPPAVPGADPPAVPARPRGPLGSWSATACRHSAATAARSRVSDRAARRFSSVSSVTTGTSTSPHGDRFARGTSETLRSQGQQVRGIGGGSCRLLAGSSSLQVLHRLPKVGRLQFDPHPAATVEDRPIDLRADSHERG